MTMNWQPIETAPHTEYILLCLGGADWAIGHWNSAFTHGGWAPGDGDEKPFTLEPTHWMPLPDLPSRDVSCSQCGQKFSSNHGRWEGYSHCKDHHTKRAQTHSRTLPK